MDLNLFMNDKYKLLKLLYDSQIKVKDDVYIALSQQEIADILHFAKLKTNQIMKELKELDYISTFKGIKGKYIITNKGLDVIYYIINFKNYYKVIS